MNQHADDLLDIDSDRKLSGEPRLTKTFPLRKPGVANLRELLANAGEQRRVVGRGDRTFYLFCRD